MAHYMDGLPYRQDVIDSFVADVMASSVEHQEYVLRSLLVRMPSSFITGLSLVQKLYKSEPIVEPTQEPAEQVE